MDILNLPDWQITNVVEHPHDYVIEAQYSIAPKFCSRCACIANFDRFGTRDARITDLPIHGKKVVIQATRQRLRCRECRYTFTVENRHIDERRRVTKRLAEYVQRQSFNRTFTSIAGELGLDDDTVRDIFKDHVRELERTIQFETPRWLGIDELHLLHRPRGILSNIQERTVVDMLQSRDKKTIIKRLLAFPNRDRVELVTMDMWNPYRVAVKATLPNARIVVDKFHLVRMANQAVEVIRKQIRAGLSDKERRALMHDRYTLLKRERDLNDHQRLILDLWRVNHPSLAQTHKLKEELFGIWDTPFSRAKAEKEYEAWKDRLGDMAVAFGELTRAIDNWHEEVFAYFDTPATNAYTEAINGLAKLANREGRGYSFDVIRAKMLFAPDNRPQPAPSTADFWEPLIREKGMEWFMEFAERIHPATPTKYGVDIWGAGLNIEAMFHSSTSKPVTDDEFLKAFSTSKSK